MVSAAEHFPVDQKRIERGLKNLDKNPQLTEETLNIPFVKHKILLAEKVIYDEKSKRENIRNKNNDAKESMGMK